VEAGIEPLIMTIITAAAITTAVVITATIIVYGPHYY